MRARASLAAMLLCAMLLALVAAGSASGAGAAASGPVHADRSFTVASEAYPMESAPGSQQTTIEGRPAATRANVSNPPVDAFARAAAADLGLAEAYVGQQGPSASADTATEGDPDDVVVDKGGSHMEAHVNPTPKATAIATGSAAKGDPATSGSMSSISTADGAGSRVVATAAAEIHDFRTGALVIGSGRFDALAAIDGLPGGGSANGSIQTSNATFGGIPIIIGADGVRVDDSQVPDPMLRQATAAIQQAFSPGGYMDVRVVQPKVEIAKDGSSARVYGGGVRVYLTNNDPADRYFFSYTLLGGSAEAVLGGVLSQPTPDRTELAVVPKPPALAFASPSPAAPPAVELPTRPAAVEPALVFASGGERVTLPGLWAGWPWVLALVSAGWVLVGVLHLPQFAGTKQRLDLLVDGLGDRYVRG